MGKLLFEETWRIINSHVGETFYTKSGRKLTYIIKGDGFFPSRTNYRISKSDFKKAFSVFPIEGPGIISNIVRGSSYIWAVLHDQRISSKG